MHEQACAAVVMGTLAGSNALIALLTRGAAPTVSAVARRATALASARPQAAAPTQGAKTTGRLTASVGAESAPRTPPREAGEPPRVVPKGAPRAAEALKEAEVATEAEARAVRPATVDAPLVQ